MNAFYIFQLSRYQALSQNSHSILVQRRKMSVIRRRVSGPVFRQCVADSDSLRSRFGEGGIGVGLDPLCIGIPTSLLPGDDLPPDLLIDPEAGKHGSGFHFDRGCGLGLQYRGVEQACRADLFGSRYVAFQKGAVQRLLDLYAVEAKRMKAAMCSFSVRREAMWVNTLE